MSQSALQRVPIESLFTSPQIRTEWDQDSLAELAANIKSMGILQPIHVRPAVEGKHEILFGARRWEAAKLAGLTQVPIIVDARPHTPAAILQMQFVENVAREDISALDKAHGIAGFMELAACSVTAAASKLGVSPANVSNLLSLLTLPDAIQQQVRSGAISATAGYELARVSDAQQQLALAEQLAAGTLPRGALAHAAKNFRNRHQRANSAPQSRATALLIDGSSVSVAAEALTLERFITSLEEVLTRARRVRGRGVELATFVRMLRDEAKSQKAMA